MKYSRRSRGLDVGRVALYGRQILEVRMSGCGLWYQIMAWDRIES